MFKVVVRLLLCLLVPLSWLAHGPAIAKFSTPADLAAFVLVSLTATLVLAIFVWALVELATSAVRLLAAKAPRRLVSGSVLVLLFASVVAVALTQWLSGFGPTLPRTLVVPVICLAAGIALWRRADALIGWLEQLATNAWRATRYPIAAVAIICAVVVSSAMLHRQEAAHAANAAQVAAVKTRPSVVLITLDSFAAEQSNLFGATQTTTPKLAAFAAHATVFDHAISASNFTGPAIASMHTGTYPWTHRIVQQQNHFASAPPTLAATLRAAGYRTAYFNANWWADPRHTLSDEGWMERHGPFDAVPMPRGRRFCRAAACDTARLATVPPLAELAEYYEVALKRLGLFERVRYPPDPLLTEAKRWLTANSDGGAPVLLWVHLFPPHDPYYPPAPFLFHFLPERKLSTMSELMSEPLHVAAPHSADDVAALRSRYREGLLYVDDRVGAFLDDPAVARILQDSIVVIAADHGESFGRDFVGHTGPKLDQSLIHIPLLIRVPRQAEPARIPAIVSQTDLMPTLIDLVGLEIPSTVEGTSLAPLLRAGSLSPRQIYSMNLERAHWRRALTREPSSIALIDWPYKYVGYHGIAGRRAELYDIEQDPNELHDLAPERADLLARYARQLQQTLEQHAQPR
jgi:arylsulfatase A-like enzyme